VEGLQTQFNFQPDQLTLQDIYAENLQGFNKDAYHLNAGGKAPLAWLNASGQTIAANTPVLRLQVTAHHAGLASSFLQIDPEAVSELYEVGQGRRQLLLTWKKQLQAAEFEIQPNPAKSVFTLSANLDSDQNCRIQLLDFQGKMLREIQQYGVKGGNRWVIPVEAAPAGVYTLLVNGRNAGRLVLVP